jgi:hypothetical protein
MSYADAAQRGRQAGPRAAQAPQRPPPMPLHHLAYLYGHSFLVDFKAVRSTATKNELADFLLKDLQLPPLDVVSFYVDHVLQHLLVTVESEAVFTAAVDRLHAGVPWAAAGGALTHGWATTENLTAVRVSCIPPFLSTDVVAAHMAQFGRVLHSHRGFNRAFPRAADGVLHLSMHLEDPTLLPGFIQVVDEQGHLAVSLAVHTDGGRRVCYKCGGGNHVGLWCRAASRLSSASPSLWSTLVVTAAAAVEVPPRRAPAPAVVPAAGAARAAQPPPDIGSTPGLDPAPPRELPVVPPPIDPAMVVDEAALAAAALPLTPAAHQPPSQAPPTPPLHPPFEEISASAASALLSNHFTFTSPKSASSAAAASTPLSPSSSIRSRSRRDEETDDEWTPASRGRQRARPRSGPDSSASPRPGGSRGGRGASRGGSAGRHEEWRTPPAAPPRHPLRGDVLTPPSQHIEDGSSQE